MKKDLIIEIKNILKQKHKEDPEINSTINCFFNIGLFDFLIKHLHNCTYKNIYKSKNIFNPKEIFFVLGQEPYLNDPYTKRIRLIIENKGKLIASQ